MDEIEVEAGTGVPENPADHQFPSQYGDARAEVAARSADGPASTPTAFAKKFVLGIRHKITDAFDHAPNMTAVITEATQRGLHPHGDVRHVATERVDERNLALSYEVEVVPAAIDADSATVAKAPEPTGPAAASVGSGPAVKRRKPTKG